MKLSKQILFTSCLILFLLIFQVFKNNAKAQKINKNSSLLWEISGNGLENSSYLFGTIHLIPKKEYFFTKIMQQKFNSCKILALEADINMSLSEQINLAEKMLLPHGKTIANYMTNEEFKTFKTFITDTLKIKKSKFKRMQKVKPFFSIALILNELIKKPISYEQKLSKLAKKNKMKITGLETLEYQMSIVEKITIEKQVKMFFIDELDKNILEEYMNLLNAYKSQDLDELQKLFDEDKNLESLEKDFLTERNNNWIPIIEKLSKKNSTFVAVGAAHLSGENGIIKLLQKKGYKVKPVKINL